MGDQLRGNSLGLRQHHAETLFEGQRKEIIEFEIKLALLVVLAKFQDWHRTTIGQSASRRHPGRSLERDSYVDGVDGVVPLAVRRIAKLAASSVMRLMRPPSRRPPTLATVSSVGWAQSVFAWNDVTVKTAPPKTRTPAWPDVKAESVAVICHTPGSASEAFQILAFSVEPFARKRIV
jgi:hypothetical protein